MTIIQDILAAVGWQTRVNENFRSVAPAGLYGINPATTTGLTLGYLGGEFNGVTVANGTVALTASATNYVVAHRTTGAVTAATNTTNWLNTGAYLQLYQLVAAGSTFAIASTSDKRQAIGGASSGGMTNPMTTTGDIIYSSSGSTPARLGAGTNGYVLTLAAGVPTWAASSGGFSNPMTTAGDLILGGASGSPGRLGIGGNGQVLTVTAGAVGWAASAAGFANPMTTVGDLIVGGASGTAGRLAAGTATYVLTSNGAGVAPTWQAAGGGGSLTNWAEAISTATPNGTVPVSSFTPANAATNVDAVIRPKGTGALLAAIPDNLTAGGNKRGDYSVDLQIVRGANSQVSSGISSGILSGQNNTNSRNYSVIAGGDGNSISGAGTRNFIGGGAGNTVTSTYGGIIVGSTCTVSGNYSIAAGNSAVVSGISSVSFGQEVNADAAYTGAFGFGALTRGLYGAEARASGYRAAAGDVQRRSVILRRTTTDATTAALVSDGSTASSTNQLNVPTGGAFKVRGQVSVKRSNGQMAGWDISCLIKNVAGTVSMVGTPVVTSIGSDADPSTYTLALNADNTNKTLQVNVTGAVGHTAYWGCELTAIEVI